MNLDQIRQLLTNTMLSSVANIEGTELSGFFDEEYTPVFEEQTEGDRITFTTATKDIEDFNHGDSVIINDREFEIKGKEKIEDGMLTSLVLIEIE